MKGSVSQPSSIFAGWTSRWPYMQTVFFPGSDPKRPKIIGGKGISSPEGSCNHEQKKKSYTFSYTGVKRNFLSTLFCFSNMKTRGFYLLFPYIHHLNCSPQFLNVLGCHLHHFFNLPTFFRPCRHTLDLHPFCQALRSQKKDVVRIKTITQSLK